MATIECAESISGNVSAATIAYAISPVVRPHELRTAFVGDDLEENEEQEDEEEDEETEGYSDVGDDLEENEEQEEEDEETEGYSE